MIKLSRIYALYKGDVNLLDGTVKELAQYLKVKEKTIRFYNSPTYKNNRVKDYSNRYIVVFIGKEFINVKN